MAYSTRRRSTNQPLVAALIAFGLFALGYFFYTPPEPAAMVEPPAPVVPSRLLSYAPDGTIDFTTAGFEFTKYAPTDHAVFWSPVLETRRITRHQLIDALIWRDTELATDQTTLHPELLARLEALPPTGDFDPFSLKTTAVTFLTSFAADPTSPHYNAQSRHLAALYRHGSWQASTGTLVYALVSLQQGPPFDSAPHPVLVFERGHVLPGFMKWTRGAWHLYGLEMTVRGHGLKTYGAVSTLGEQGLAVRIWTAVAPFATNADAVAITMLKETARRFQIPLVETERNVQAQAAGDPPLADIPTTQIRAPWAFGRCFVPPGDLPFIKRDRIPLVDTMLPYPEILAARAANRRPAPDSDAGEPGP
jgi:hypothetical protein